MNEDSTPKTPDDPTSTKAAAEGWLSRTECPGCHGIFGARYLADHMLDCVPWRKRDVVGRSKNEEVAALEQRLDTIMADVRRVRAMKDALDRQVASVAGGIQEIKQSERQREAS